VDTEQHKRTLSKQMMVTGAVRTVIIVAIIAVVLVIQKPSGLKSGSIPATADNGTLVTASYEILEYMKDSDFKALSRIVHPTYGVLFSPYATISESTAKVFTAAQVRVFATDKAEYIWGTYDGSGDPISLTPCAYFAEFVFDRDYIRSSLVGINRTIRSGNALENISETRPGIRYVDFHIPPDTDDGDWGSLRLGFEEYNGSLMLTVVLHSRKTI